MKRLFGGLIIAVALLVASASHAALITRFVTLSGTSEIPPVMSPGTGTATILLDDVAHTLRVIVNFSGLLAGVTAAHIHCCNPIDVNSPVATAVPTFPGFPSGVTIGSYDETFNLLLSSSYNPVFVTAQGGTLAGAEAALTAGIATGIAYLNIHTTLFPGGEIRGLTLAQSVPEPGTLALLAIAVVVLALIRRQS
jgi:hypothetical protein